MKWTLLKLFYSKTWFFLKYLSVWRRFFLIIKTEKILFFCNLGNSMSLTTSIICVTSRLNYRLVRLFSTFFSLFFCWVIIVHKVRRLSWEFYNFSFKLKSCNKFISLTQLEKLTVLSPHFNFFILGIIFFEL